jgi:hypothetical protein
MAGQSKAKFYKHWWFFLPVGIITVFISCVAIYDGFHYARVYYRNNVAYAPPASGSPSFPFGTDLGNQGETLFALQNLDTSVNYKYTGGSINNKGFSNTPSVNKETGSQFIKFAINGSRGPLVLKAPATLTIQVWIDPESHFSNCSQGRYSVSSSGHYKETKGTADFEGITQELSNSVVPPTKLGNLISTKIENVPPLILTLGISCDNADKSESKSEIEVYVFE